MSKTSKEEKVTLATFEGQGDQLEIDGHIMLKGVQYEVTHGMKGRLQARHDVRVVEVVEGSDDDQRQVEPELTPLLGEDDAPVLHEVTTNEEE